ncbi:MAG: hypothetical protein FJ100_22375 [Deltaproteobacteria bacterium]|nr:hypothetical protein [Deltaproteobacteria bacterium]
MCVGDGNLGLAGGLTCVEGGEWSVQGEFAGGWVPSAGTPRARSQRASHEAPATLLRGAASIGLASRLELSLWGDLGHRALARNTVTGIHKGELNESTSAWGGFTLRNRFPIGAHAVRLSSEFGVGRVPWARLVRVTDWVRRHQPGQAESAQRQPLTMDLTLDVQPPGEQWERFQDAFIRRGVAVAVRTAVFAQAELRDWKIISRSLSHQDGAASRTFGPRAGDPRSKQTGPRND